jgi:hypothetical protein
MRIKNCLFILLFTGLAFKGSSQEYPKNYFRSPLEIPLLLSGTFGELRTNHFHTGLDIKTNGEGQKIYACADGYITRVQVSHYGYGLVLYMDHPNGYTTVYAHLSKFHPKIADFVRTHQYAQQRETVNLTFLPDTALIFKKGDVIGWSGNTGSSGGPHLHFEVRETKTEKALNPWLFGFDIKDDVPPLIHHLKVFPLDNNSRVKSNTNPVIYNLAGTGKNYKLTGDTVVRAGGKIGFALHTIDMTTGSGNLCGIYRIKLFRDDSLIFQQEMSCIDFSTNRYINAHMDYYEYKNNKNSYHKSFINANNQLDIYPVKVENGIINVTGSSPIKMKYVVEDVKGNKSILPFTIIPTLFLAPTLGNEEPMPGYCDESNQIFSFMNLQWQASYKKETSDFSLLIPEKGIYENHCMQYVKEAKRKGMIAPVHNFGDPEVPVQDYMELKIKTDSLPEHLHSKVLGVFIGKSGGVSSEGGKYENGWIVFKTRSFGRYSAMIDSVAPVITPVNITNGKILGAQTTITFSISDNLAGIDSYNAFIDDKWILMNYNTRTGKITINLDKEKVKAGEHQLLVKVGDTRGNLATFSAKFTR